MSEEMFWTGGDKGRALSLCRPCPCGCDERDGYHGVGYITGSDSDGTGFSLWIEEEAVYQAVRTVFLDNGLDTER